jgi:hypothetical protein
MSSVIIAGNTSGSITLSAPAVSGSSVLTLPASTDTLVGKATTDTLTNKTLTSPTITGTGSILASSIGGNVTQSNIVTTYVTGSTTAGTYTDTGASLSLVAGTYLITTMAPLALESQSGTNIAYRLGKLVLTDNSNTIIAAGWAGASTSNGVYNMAVSFVLTVTSTTTYKTRFTTSNNSGTPTLGGFSMNLSSGDLVSHNIIATRLT